MTAVRGRPREAHVHDAAMRAALELVAEAGYARVSMEKVAERAGVSKASLYRRWPNKLDLVTDAIRDFASTQSPVPDTGCLREDIQSFLRDMVSSRATAADTRNSLKIAVLADEELAGRCRPVLANHFTDSFRTMIDRGLARGDLPPGTDAELYAELIPALVRFRLARNGEPIDGAFIERMVDQFFPARRGG